ncbi:hypothetical protein HG536_0D06070 [Torulaspora globosa]|uniref:Reduced meiotic recombination protein 1 n=1 Tax=Torulaspora globosa TaxID=48254 RepID=A0A7G3ZHU8_9SACH|nr:uncharacterized protein HG536_0D06070 [Torulaspora globosa]QLL33084.1 hypothetical protein HG536_0D06070 [Torulaspora globosa]
MSAGDGIQVSLVDEEEDLLGYDDVPEEGSEDELESGSNGTDQIEARKAAEMLLKKEKPCVTVSYETDLFLLFDCDDQTGLPNVSSIICEKESDLHDSCSGLFASLRRFLEEFYGSLSFLSKELLLDIPCLDIVLCEDNIYNGQITFDDIATIFKILKERSERNMEHNIPRWLETRLTVRPRFVSRYNALVELTQTSATLGNIKPFTNDSSNPLVLDDTSTPAVAVVETVTMDVDDEDEGGEEDRMEDRGQDRPRSHGEASENESDELLEIVDEEADEEENSRS